MQRAEVNSPVRDDKLAARMLYLVGGTGNAERVDVSDLFAEQLSRQGLEVDYIIFSRDAGPAWKESRWRGARAWTVGRSLGGGNIGSAVRNKFRELYADLRTFGLALTGPYDIVQVRDKFVVGVLCAIATKLRPRIFTYWLSYPYAECRVLDAREGRARVPWLSLIGGKTAEWLLYKIIMPAADHVFVQSEQMLRDVAVNGIPESKMTAVPMAVNESLLDYRGPAAVANSILYLGSLIRVRRLDVLIEALVIVRRTQPLAHLVFVGDGDEPADRQMLERAAEDLGVSEAVEFTGMVPMPEAQARTARAAVCVSPFYPTPILQSTSPTKICEYMALGRPVVANTHPEQSRILKDSGAGYCVEWSAEAFAQAIVKLLAEPEKAEEMGAAGRAYVREHRIYPVIAKQVAAQYGRLLTRAVHPD